MHCDFWFAFVQFQFLKKVKERFRKSRCPQKNIGVFCIPSNSVDIDQSKCAFKYPNPPPKKKNREKEQAE